MKTVIVLMILLLGSVVSVSAAYSRMNVITLPADYRINSIYFASKGENIAWSNIRRIPLDNLITLIQSANARVTAEKFSNGKWSPMTKQELLTLLNSDKVGSQSLKSLKSAIMISRSSGTRKSDSTKCNTIYNPFTREGMSMVDFNRMPESSKKDILSHPTTRKYLRSYGCKF